MRLEDPVYFFYYFLPIPRIKIWKYVLRLIYAEKEGRLSTPATRTVESRKLAIYSQDATFEKEKNILKLYDFFSISVIASPIFSSQDKNNSDHWWNWHLWEHHRNDLQCSNQHIIRWETFSVVLVMNVIDLWHLNIF